jgi:hypothetical protein
MKLFFLCLIITPSLLLGQNRKTSTIKLTNAHYYKLLLGRWRSESDRDWVIKFTNAMRNDIIKKDTNSELHFYYKFSSSCELKDTLKSKSYNKKINLLFFYNESQKLSDCVEIENLSGKYLSWFNERVGKYFLFRKIK